MSVKLMPAFINLLFPVILSNPKGGTNQNSDSTDPYANVIWRYANIRVVYSGAEHLWP